MQVNFVVSDFFRTRKLKFSADWKKSISSFDNLLSIVYNGY
ncbi:hypothetical protein NBRC111894_1913 [Sporolactobacillus inulinus]|uniref:Uncharacterized protein n=1 Tax=Sporolactobacillus inulinus TaxID=2078 RepID=A0A4Y1ZBF4_9BACL|nr:hypothetical protein NBRC111894_1913 [Sporolactobacillus inulinus]